MRMNSHANAAPMTIICSSAMIAPPIAWSSLGDRPQKRGWRS